MSWVSRLLVCRAVGVIFWKGAQSWSMVAIPSAVFGLRMPRWEDHVGLPSM